MSVSSTPSGELSPLKRALLALDKMQARLDALEAEKREPIAITGMSCRFPGGANSPQAFWQMLLEGRDGVGEFPSDRPGADAWLNPTEDQATNQLVCRGGFLSDVEQFDAGFFGISPREAQRMDPQQRLLLSVAWEALESAGQTMEGMAGSNSGVFIGIHSQSSDYYLLQALDPHSMDTYTSTGGAHSIVANRLSYFLDLRGPSMALDTACSSSLVALHLACRSLRSGECDLALAGGVNLLIAPETSLAFSKLQFLAPDGRCKSFDASANGFVRAEGCGVLVLRRLRDAVKEGDPILAVIRGTAVNQDGATNGLTAPNGLSQQAVVRAALADGGVSPESLSYVETHGTGTALGDPIEVEALQAVLGPRVRCLLGAVKSNIGHAEAAAGIAGVIKAVLALQHRVIPPNLHFRALNPHIRLAGTLLEVPTTATPWSPAGADRFAGVSSFGFGGTNAHVILQQAPPSDEAVRPPGEAAGPWLLPISARGEAALDALAGRWIEFLRGGVARIDEVIESAQRRRTHHPYRLAVVGANSADLAARLERAQRSGSAIRGVAGSGAGGIVFVFSGQGPQWCGMGRELLAREPVFRAELEEIDRLARPALGWSLLAELHRAEAESRWDRTDVAQPGIFAIQMGLAALWRAHGIEPDRVAGHSIGEVAAACTAGVLSLADAVTVVVHRGRLMQQVARRGRMVAAEISPEEAQPIVARQGGRVSLAAVNAPRSVTLSGDEEAVAEVVAQLEAGQVLCRPLKVNFAFHSAHMDPALDELRQVLREVQPRPARVPVLSTVSGAPAMEGDYGADYWVRNVRHTVLFGPAIHHLVREGHACFVELAPHPVLAESISAVLRASGLPGQVIASMRRGRPEVETFLEGLGALYVSGSRPTWRPGEAPRRRFVPLPGYPWQTKPYWLGATARRRNPSTPATPGAGAATTDTDVDPLRALSWTYDVEWRERGRLTGGPPAPSLDFLPPLAQLEQDLRPRFEALREAHGTAWSPALLADLEQAAGAYVRQALAELGLGRQIEPGLTTSELAERLGIVPAQRRLLPRLLRILEEDGGLRREGDGWRSTSAEAPGGSTEPLARLERHEVSPEAGLLARCGRQLAKVLQGKCDPLQLLFSNDASLNAETLYRDSWSARLHNRWVSEWVEAIARALPSERSLRILEIGAGTGGTTQALVDHLPPGQTDYLFTDLGRLLLAEARKKFARHPFVRFQTLDIETDPGTQGLASGQFSLVIAANVLHATRDVRATLARVRSLLAPGGWLLLLETTATRRWIDLIFGLTEGWWRFEDFTLRPDHPLLQPAQWRQLLSEAGFEPMETGATDHSGAVHAQTLFVARSIGGKPRQAANADLRARGNWLVFGDREGTGAALNRRLREAGGHCLMVYPGSSFQADNAGEVTVNPGDPQDFGRLLALTPPVPSEPWRGIIQMWPVAPGNEGSLDAEALERGEALGCRAVLHLVQALARTGHSLAGRLWLVTRGSHPAHGGPRTESLVAGTVWGFGRSLALEHPDLWGGLVDLDPGEPPEEQAAALLEELLNPAGDWEVAVSAARRRVPRLVRRTLPAVRETAFDPAGTCLITGGLGGVGLKLARWLVESGARQLVLAGRTGLPARKEWAQLPPDSDPGRAARAVMEMEGRGAHVLVERMDVADLTQVTALVARVAADGHPLRSVFHAAGQAGFGAITEQDAESLRIAFRAKILGGWNLHEATRHLRLDHFVLFSSMTALLGAKGLAPYAASNCFLDALAAWRRTQDLPGLSVSWGAWDVIRLVKAEAARDVSRFGLRPMESARALGIFGRLLAESRPFGVVADVDWRLLRAAFEVRGPRTFLEEIDEQAKPGAAPASTVPAWRDRLAGLAGEELGEALAQLVEGQVRQVLEIDPADPLDPRRGFFEMGMDSLMTVQLRSRLEAALGKSLPSTLAFNHPSVNALAAYLARELSPPAPEAAPPPPSLTAAPATGSETREVDQLTDDEARTLLASELASLPDDIKPDSSEPM